MAADKKSELYSVVRLFQISVAFTSLLTKITGERHDVDLHLLSSLMETNYINQCMSESMAILHAFFM